MKRFVITAATLGALASSAAAQQPPQVTPSGTILNLSVDAQVKRAPDVALFSAGVTTQAPTAQTAMADNARRMSAVVAALGKAGIADRDIQTRGVNLSPQYVYPSRRDPAAEQEPPRIVGYQASNIVQVRLRKLGEMGRIMDVLVAEGANQIQGPHFMLDDPEPALDEARAEALQKARARAELYARTAGLRVTRIVSINEQGGYAPPPPPPMPYGRGAVALAAAPATPVAPGEVTAGVNLSVQFALDR